MLSVNRIITATWLKKLVQGWEWWKGAQLTELGWLSSWVQSRVRIPELMNNEDRCSGITLWVKRRGQLIVRLKAIESREDTFRYLSSYLHRSFLWHLVIIHPLHHQVVEPNAETSGRIVSRTSARIVALSDRLQSSNHLQPSNHQGLEVSFILYVTHPMPTGGGRNRDRNCSRYYYLVWELFKWSFLLHNLINHSEVRAAQDAISSSW